MEHQSFSHVPEGVDSEMALQLLMAWHHHPEMENGYTTKTWNKNNNYIIGDYEIKFTYLIDVMLLHKCTICVTLDSKK